MIMKCLILRLDLKSYLCEVGDVIEIENLKFVPSFELFQDVRECEARHVYIYIVFSTASISTIFTGNDGVLILY